MLENELSPGLKPQQHTLLYTPGSRVRVTQQIAQREGPYATTVEGQVVRQERQGSGSWFARNKKAKVWLDRLILRKDDGEISVLNLDEYSRIEVLQGEQPQPGLPPLVLPGEDNEASIT